MSCSFWRNLRNKMVEAKKHHIIIDKIKNNKNCILRTLKDNIERRHCDRKSNFQQLCCGCVYTSEWLWVILKYWEMEKLAYIWKIKSCHWLNSAVFTYMLNRKCFYLIVFDYSYSKFNNGWEEKDISNRK